MDGGRRVREVRRVRHVRCGATAAQLRCGGCAERATGARRVRQVRGAVATGPGTDFGRIELLLASNPRASTCRTGPIAPHLSHRTRAPHRTVAPLAPRAPV